MSLIDTSSHPVTCPHCESEQNVRLNVPIGSSRTARFECMDCQRQFDVTVAITYTLDVEEA